MHPLCAPPGILRTVMRCASANRSRTPPRLWPRSTPFGRHGSARGRQGGAHASQRDQVRDVCVECGLCGSYSKLYIEEKVVYIPVLGYTHDIYIRGRQGGAHASQRDQVGDNYCCYYCSEQLLLVIVMVVLYFNTSDSIWTPWTGARAARRGARFPTGPGMRQLNYCCYYYC